MSIYLPRLTLPLCLALCAAAAAASPTAAWAASPTGDQPEVSARAFAALPAGAAVSVEPRDDTDANLRLRDLMAARLRAQGHPVLASAPYRLRFSTETLTVVGPGEGAAASDNLIASDRQTFAATNLNYSEADRFFNPGNDRAKQGDIQVGYQLRASLDARDGGKVLWSGQASGSVGDRDEKRLAAEFAETLADLVGRDFDTHAAAAPEPAPARVLAMPTDQPATTVGALRLPWPVLPELAERR
jgi:hypothetical protein